MTSNKAPSSLTARLRAAQKRTGLALEGLRGSRAEAASSDAKKTERSSARPSSGASTASASGLSVTAVSVAGLCAVREALAKGDLAGDVQLANVTDASGTKELADDESVILIDASSYPNFKCAKRARPKRRITVHAKAVRTKQKQDWTLEDVADFARKDPRWEEIASPVALSECAQGVLLLLVGPTCAFNSLVAAVEALADARDTPREALQVYLHLLDRDAQSDVMQFWMHEVPALLRGSEPTFREVGLVMDRFASTATSITKASVWAAHMAARENRPIHVLMPRGLQTRMRAQLPEHAQNIFSWISTVRVELCRFPSLCSAESSEAILEANLQLEAEILKCARAVSLDSVSEPVRSALMSWAVQSSRVVLERLGNRIAAPTGRDDVAGEAGDTTYNNEPTQTVTALDPDSLALAARARALAETSALALVNAARWKEACEALDAALRFEALLHPEPAADLLSISQLLCHRARCCSKLSRTELGLRDAIRADELLAQASPAEKAATAGYDLCLIDALQLRADLERQSDKPGAKAEALATLSRLLEVKTRVFGAEHAEVLATSESLVELQLELQQGSAAILSAVKALQLSKQLNGEKHPHTARCFNLMGRAMAMQSQTSEATKMLSRAIEIHAAIFGEKDPRLADFRRDLEKLQAA